MIILFATSEMDARHRCILEDVAFEEVIWVLNPELLGNTPVDDDAVVLYTDTYRQMPVYEMTFERFGPEGTIPETPEDAEEELPETV